MQFRALQSSAISLGASSKSLQKEWRDFVMSVNALIETSQQPRHGRSECVANAEHCTPRKRSALFNLLPVPS
jgi:hypothetical protein